MRFWFLLTAGLFVLAAAAEDAKPLTVRDRAIAAWKARNYTNALSLASEAISGTPKDPRLWNFRAQMRSILGDYSGAVTDLTEALRLAPDAATLYQERAIARFKLGQIPECIPDFDRANALDPADAPQNWQRGLALYYARRFADGKQQFELHRTVNPRDVENAVWHYACVARAEGLEAAKKQLMDISGDGRIPMAEIHDLFTGEGDEADVLEAVREASGDADEKKSAEFYAQLYLGLYHDLNGRPDPAIAALRKAVAAAPPGEYMSHVARIHLQQLTSPTPSTAPAASVAPVAKP